MTEADSGQMEVLKKQTGQEAAGGLWSRHGGSLYSHDGGRKTVLVVLVVFVEKMDVQG